jgi:hypothetical protein
MFRIKYFGPRNLNLQLWQLDGSTELCRVKDLCEEHEG